MFCIREPLTRSASWLILGVRLTMIPPRDTLPKDLDKWKEVQVSLPRLPQDSPQSCPDPLSEIMAYVRIESADGRRAKRESLKFVRTAEVGDSRYWLWTYTESGGEICYVYFREQAGRGSELSLQGTRSLTPEQFMLANHYDKL